MKLNTTLRDKYARIELAKRLLRDAIRKRYPIGATVVYKRGEMRMTGTVMGHSDSDDQIRVRSRTGAIYLILASATLDP